MLNVRTFRFISFDLVFSDFLNFVFVCLSVQVYFLHLDLPSCFFRNIAFYDVSKVF